MLLCRNVLTLRQVPGGAIIFLKYEWGELQEKTSVEKDCGVRKERTREQGENTMRKPEQTPVTLYLTKSQFSLINK